MKVPIEITGLIETWDDLVAEISKLSPEQRSQPIQCVLSTPNDDDVQECLPGIAFDTVANFGFHKIRSTHDNRYHGEDFVLLLDHNQFDGSGAIGYRFLCPVGDSVHDDTDLAQQFIADGRIGREPIYGPHGKTDVSQQTRPVPADDLTKSELASAMSRLRNKMELDQITASVDDERKAGNH